MGRSPWTVNALRTLPQLLIIAVAIVAPSVAWALDATRAIAQFQHRSWTTTEGMPADVWSITQTRDGFMLLGSVNGLYRFDGVKIEQLAVNLLPSPSVHTVAATSDGGLWIGFERPIGVISYLKDGHVTNYPITAPSTTKIWRILIAPDGTPWANTADNVLRFNGKNWVVVDSDWGSALGQAGGGVWEFGIAPDGTVWSKNEHNLFYLLPGAKRFKLADGYPGGPEAFTLTPNGQLATADAVTRRVYLLPLVKNLGESKIPPPAPIAELPYSVYSPMLIDRNKSVWYTSLDNGALGRTRINGSTSPTFDLFTDKQGLSSNFVHAIFEDREGNVWVGTSIGLDRFSPANVVTEPRVPVGYRDRLVKATADNLYAYTGWWNTNTKLTKGTGTLFRIGKDSVPVVALDDFGRLRNMFTNSETGEIWVTTDKGVQRLSRDGVLETPIKLPEGVRITQVYAGAEDSQGSVWISVFHAGVFKRAGNVWHKINVKPKTAATAVLLAGPNGSMWIRYSGGSLFRVQGETIQDFSGRLRDIGDVTLISNTSHGLIIGGEAGIALFDGTGFSLLKAADVPALSVATGVAETKDGSIWLFAQAGVLRVEGRAFEKAVKHSDAKAFKYQLLDSHDGLPGAAYGAVYGSAAASGPDGRVWFTTGDGLAWVDPNNLFQNPLPPPVVVRTLTANDRTFSSPNGARLDAGTSKMEIEYTALSLSMPERVRFRYRLDGVDEGWVDAGNRRQAFYTGLGPGQYRFHVIASNNDGVWNSRGASFVFAIPPTFLQSRAFFALCAVAAAALLFAAYQWRLTQVSLRLRSQLEARMGERERIARDLHDTLLQGFHGLMLRFQSVADSIPPDQPARVMIEDVMNRADQVLAEGRDRVHDLRGSVDPGDLAEALEDVAKNAAGGDSVKFDVVVEGTPYQLHPVVCDELVQLASEAILNAYRHARAKHIGVKLAYERAVFRMSICDDGIGIESDVIKLGGRHGHFGLPGMRERAKKIKAQFILRSNSTIGTEIDVAVPAAAAYVKQPRPHWGFWRSRSATGQK